MGDPCGSRSRIASLSLRVGARIEGIIAKSVLMGVAVRQDEALGVTWNHDLRRCGDVVSCNTMTVGPNWGLAGGEVS
jgi:hypothetical protein